MTMDELLDLSREIQDDLDNAWKHGDMDEVANLQERLDELNDSMDRMVEALPTYPAPTNIIPFNRSQG